MSANTRVATHHAGEPRRKRGRRALLLGVTAALAVPVMSLGSGGDAAGGAITTPPFELADAGSLTLQTGGVNAVVRRDAQDTLVSTQTLNVASSCGLTTNGTLLTFATAKGVPGLNSGTIGDKTKGSGTDCGLVESPNSVTLNLGTDVADLAISSFAFDIETRKNVRLVLTAKYDGRQTAVYELRSGSSIVAGQGSSIAGSAVFNCNSGASSDPNAADRDNCRFEGAVLADELVLAASAGEFGVSGGASGGVSRPSVLELTQFDGFLDCASQPNNGEFGLTEGGDGTPRASISRKENLDPAEPCSLIPVALDTRLDGTTPEVEFLKDLTDQTSSAFTLDITWTFEGAQNPPPPTMFEFVEGEQFELELCLGTPVYDGNGTFDGIAELLDGDPGNDDVVPDLSTSLPGIQYSCYYEQETKLVGDGTVQLRQKTYLVGDFRSFR